MADESAETSLSMYIAADFARADEADALAHLCEQMQVRIVSSWHRRPDATEVAAAGSMGGPPASQALTAAERNLRELRSADGVIVLTTGERARGGRHFETGVAYSSSKRVILVGPVEHAFHHLPGIEHVDAVPDLLSLLSEHGER